jgi:hypothetical protein
MQTIQITEEVYRRLSEQAARLHLTPEQMIERLLTPLSLIEEDGDLAVPAPGSEEALAAVRRLNSLFADVSIPNLDAVLADPMIALASADLDDIRR